MLRLRGEYDYKERRHLLQQAKEFFRKNRGVPQCHCPAALKSDCATKIIESHTLPRSGALKAIADNDKVVSFMATIDPKMTPDDIDNLSWREIYTRNASAIPVFCQRHDNDLFACIEDEDIEPTSKQAFMMHFRAVVREMYSKSTHEASNDYARSSSYTPTLRAKIQRDFHWMVMRDSIREGVKDIAKTKERLDAMLAVNDYSGIRYLFIEFAGEPFAATSGAAMIENDFVGNLVQDLREKPTGELVSLTWIPHRGKVLATICWIDGELRCGERFANSLFLVEQDKWADAIIRFAVAYFENSYFNPSWWNRSIGDRESDLYRLVMSGHVDPENRDPLVLVKPSNLSTEHKVVRYVKAY